MVIRRALVQSADPVAVFTDLFLRRDILLMKTM